MSDLNIALETYSTKVDDLENDLLSADNVLDILLARDYIEKLLEAGEGVSSRSVNQILKLDDKLKKKADKMARLFDLANQYRENNIFCQQKWWWNLDEYAFKSDSLNRFDELYKNLRLIAWSFNITLLATLVGKLISSSSGIYGVVGIGLSTIFPLFLAKNELTESGQKTFNNGLKKLKFSENWYEEARLGSTLLLTLILFLCWVYLPLGVALLYNRDGQRQYNEGNLEKAENNFKKVIELDPSWTDAYYSLGEVYEDLQDEAKAQEYYSVGVKRNDAKSIAALGFLLLQANKDDKDVEKVKIRTNRSLQSVLSEISKIEKTVTKDDKNSMTDKLTKLRAIQASLRRNLGWAYLKQKKRDEAENHLNTAKTLFCDIININKKEQIDVCPIRNNEVENNTKKVPISIQDAEIASDVETIVGSNASFFCLLAEFKTQDVNENKEACKSLILKKSEYKLLTLGEEQWKMEADKNKKNK